ncbi:Wzz/FepE/Etk N-terminal domain-containing protein [Actinomadura sp. BRA 177]|uniref:Wzz/FepE/Etk N-terminal domain-containing protein n=1 Tax=Actinomadura sp. BRA 177 TaxID=2745202 RepID=UPI0020CC5A53|nr:Wzz/FepE/Etk N-terminal domain-containing protein [Actinomadura sp. BRA 177]
MPQREARTRPGRRRVLDTAVRRARGPATALLRRFGLAIAFVLAGLLGGLGYGLFAPTTYTATAFVLVVDDGGDSGPAAVSFAQAFGRLAPLPETLEHSSIPLPRHAAGDTREHIQASTSPDTPLIRLAGSARTARDAAAFANAAADALVKYGTQHRADTGVRVALMTLAEPPAAPSSPNLVLDVAAGTASGVLLAGLSAAIMSGRRGARREWARHAAIPAPATADRIEVRS